MNTLYLVVLSGHILSGVGSIIGYGSYALLDKNNLKKLNIALFAVNTVSAVMLLLLKPQSITHFCGGLAGYTLMVASLKFYSFVKTKNTINID